VPKLKTHKGTKGRFHITGTGKIMRAHGGKSHKRITKTPRTKRMFDEMVEVSPVDKPRLKRLLPYGLK
jgi:large subunit ribosomal protein L35